VDTCPLVLSFLANRWLDCKVAKILEGLESLVLDSLFMEATEPFDFSLPVLENLDSHYEALNWDRHLPGEHPLQSIKIRLK
jgi:hypothetical protein